MKLTRQQNILELLGCCDWLTTDALAETLAVSRAIRRDLNALQQQGKILRQHGRARLIHRTAAIAESRLARA